jgi:group I intron endonuclease
MPLVYKHTNSTNGKAYIGWTNSSISECWRGHIKSAKRGSKYAFHRAIQKYGIDAWIHEILGEFASCEEAKSAEIRLISEHQTFIYDYPDKGYNMTRGGEGMCGCEMTFETKLKMSSWHRIVSTETHSNLSKAGMGRKWSEEDRIKHKNAQERTNRRGNPQQVVLLCGGPDRCGKTTILREIERITGINYFKVSNEHENFLLSQDRFINEIRYAEPRFVDVLYQLCTSVLVDRAYMCEWVYAQYFKRETDLRMLRKLDYDYTKIGAKILICTRKSFVGICDDLDPTINEKALTYISELYHCFKNWSHGNVHILYVDDEDLDRQVKEVLEFIEWPEVMHKKIAAVHMVK